MKKMVCEMCDSTSFTKQDGVFVCGGCGTRYSVEEAKKLMVEVEGEPADVVPTSTPAPASAPNNTQVENLLRLALSSYESKNYSQAEDFCNQVIALDASNYEAWKLKGEAINFQITTKNPRILEVYNCIITSYKVLDEAGKDAHRKEIIKTLRVCLEGEIDFWLEQFEAQRPSDAMLAKVKNSYTFCVEKMTEAFRIMGYEQYKAKAFKEEITDYFVRKANSTVVSTWKTTVYYNYHRDGWTDEFRPNAEILKTYLNEGGNLISLLSYCTTIFTDSFPVNSKATVYGNMIFYHKQLIDAKSYKRMVSTTTNGYGAVTDRREYWELDMTPTDDAINSRKSDIAKYESKVEQLFIKDCENMSAEKIFEQAQKDLDGGKPLYAKHRFEAYIMKEPQSVIGYIGKAIAMYDNDEAESAVLSQVMKSSELKVPEAEKETVKKLVNRPSSSDDDKITLLLIAANNYNLLAVAHLINLGADINYKAPDSKVTALWFVARKRPTAQNEVAARKIAKLLLDRGASVDVTNKGGVALYNNDTDSEIAKMIREKNPSISKGAAAAKSGCYVATAVYGSYNCPEVWTLRRYRDNRLAKSIAGRAFIKTYYAISPTIVKWFGKTEWFKKMWRGTLDRMVENLQKEGFESTPYNDINWQ